VPLKKHRAAESAQQVRPQESAMTRRLPTQLGCLPQNPADNARKVSALEW